MANTFVGKAQVAGSKFLADVILYPIANSLKLTHKWEEDKVKDEQGDDYSKRGHNEMYDGDIGMILVDKSSTSLAANAKSGGVFLAPYATVTISTCDLAIWNGAWTYEPDASIDQENTATGKMSYKLTRYANSTQNTLMTTTPG
jgi:hypothetical protein